MVSRSGNSSRRTRVSFVLLVAAMGGTLVSCSDDPDLSQEQRSVALELVAERSMDAAIDLSNDDLFCVVDAMGPADLQQLETGYVDQVADLVVSCVGSELLGRSVLRSQAGEISDPSLDCAVAELDRRFVVDLVAGAMVDEVPRARVEIEVARVLSLCLQLDELL